MGEDVDALDAALAAVSSALTGSGLQACTDAAAVPILKAVKERAPDRTGNLLNHIDTISTHAGSTATTSVQVDGSGPGGSAREAIFLEYGTSKMAAKPFMRPAFESSKQQALAKFEEQLSHQLKDFQ